jgi:hypothetical protein
MKFVHKISVFILLLIITFSSVGISFYFHQCGCRETTFLSVETGYNKPAAFCCCETDVAVSNTSDASRSIENEDCCKDQYVFFLLPFGPEKNTDTPVVVDYKIISHLFDNFVATEIESPKAVNDTPLLHSPPDLRAGKELVYFISQIKIPFPCLLNLSRFR